MREIAKVLLVLAEGFNAAFAGTWEIRPADSSVMELTVGKTGLLSGKKHLFAFADYAGTLGLNKDAPAQSAISFSIGSGAISCRDTWLIAGDVRKVQEYAVKERPAAARYPQITFRSTAIRVAGANQYEVWGSLTSRDGAKPTVVMVFLRGRRMDHQCWKGRP